MLKISIPTPCHENWSGMTPENGGRFCGSCQKTVVDFTAMTDAEVLSFFVKKAEKTPESRVCGRFKNQQLDRNLQTPPPSSYPLWRNNIQRFAQASLLVSVLYFSSCESDSVVSEPVKTTCQKDTTADFSDIVGMIAPPKPFWILPDFEAFWVNYPPPPPPPEMPPPPKNTIEFLPPVITGDIMVDKTPPKISDFKDTIEVESQVKKGEISTE
jgi:hypothetical protein